MFTIVPRRESAASQRPQRPTCIDLRAQFGKRFKVCLEESYYAERPEFRAAEAAWLMVIPCDRGHIYPHGGTTLAVFIGRGPRVKQLSRVPGVRMKTDGDDGVTFVFDVADFDRVAEIVQPRRRRTVSDTERARLAEVGARTRFRHGVGSRPGPEESTIAPRLDILAVPFDTASPEAVIGAGG